MKLLLKIPSMNHHMLKSVIRVCCAPHREQRMQKELEKCVHLHSKFFNHWSPMTPRLLPFSELERYDRPWAYRQTGWSSWYRCSMWSSLRRSQQHRHRRCTVTHLLCRDLRSPRETSRSISLMCVSLISAVSGCRVIPLSNGKPPNAWVKLQNLPKWGLHNLFNKSSTCEPKMTADLGCLSTQDLTSSLWTSWLSFLCLCPSFSSSYHWPLLCHEVPSENKDKELGPVTESEEVESKSELEA